MEMINIKELTQVINNVKEAIDNSKFGPMFMHTNELDPMEKQCNQIALNIYFHLITPIMQEYTKNYLRS